MHVRKKIILFFSVLLLAGSCKEKYVPNLNLSASSFLVVEGFINSATGPTIITLTRTNKVIDTAAKIYERSAVVTVQGENGTSASLTETSPGIYSIPQLTINAGTRYRIYIKTQNGKEYQSDFSDVRRTPDIDSVSWKRKDGGVQTYVNTHDPLNKTRYYQWKYDETWEFHSQFLNTLKYTYDLRGKISGVTYKDSLRPAAVDTSIFICWKTNPLTSINIGSSEKLAKDEIFEQLTAYIPPNTQQLSILYSIDVKQYALSDKAYRFLQQMKKNTEQLGTIFDAQPSDNNGNIHCVTNPGETVIGFVEVSEEKEKRLFISNAQVPDWNYKAPCATEIKVLNYPDSLTRYGAGLLLTTVAEYGGPTGILYVYMGEPFCINCTFTGSNKKPVFWP